MSKSKELTHKYEAIRSTIQMNLNTIRTLIQQADDLTALIEQAGDDEFKNSLQASVKSLYDTIDTLIKESNKLFDQYLDFANSIAD